MKKVLFISGNSGSGKSYITNNLIKNYPDVYYKLEQYTTRPKRNENENEYYYVSKYHYDLIKDTLIANTKVNGNYYGTIPTLIDDKIAIIIVNALGLKNGLNYVKKHKDIVYRIIHLENDVPFESRDDFRDTYEESRNIITELGNLSTNSYKILLNTVKKPLKINEINSEIESLFNINDKGQTIVHCPWKTCIHNSGKTEICKSNKINLISLDSESDGETLNLLDCISYSFDDKFMNK